VQKVTELLWRGRIQLGDEPGIYSDAQYGGLTLDLPVELLAYSGDATTNGEVVLIIEAREVKIYQGYAGHPVTVFALTEGADGKWQRQAVAHGELNNDNEGRAELLLRRPIPRYVSIRVEENSQLPPGLYDEIVVHRLSIRSETHYGYLGWRFPNATA